MSLVVILLSNKNMEAVREAAKNIVAENQERKSTVAELANITAGSFAGVILEEDQDVEKFKIILKNSDIKLKASLIEWIAELAKTEQNRSILTRNGIIGILLHEIEGNDSDVMLQCFRAVGNICIHNDEGRKDVLNSGCIGNILEKFKLMADLSDDELGNLPKMAYGCVNNISDENESLQLELISHGAVPIFFNCFRSFTRKDNDMAQLVMEALSGLAAYDEAKEQFIELQVVEESLSMLPTCTDKIALVILDSLCELIEDDELSRVMCSEKCLMTLITAGKSRDSFNKQDIADDVLKKIFDTIVLFTSNESFQADCSEKNLLNSFLELLKCENKYVQASGALALGNYARNDMVCTDLVKEGVHEALISLLKTLVDKEDTAEQMQAALSALKNIAIPVANKSVLISLDLPNIAASVVKTSSSVLQFKALAILRLLVQGQADLTAHLCKDSVLLQAVAECAKKDVITGLCAEARRLTAALVKNSQCSDAFNTLLANDAMQSLIGLLSSDHFIMQNEGLVAIITLLSSGKDAVEKFIKADGLEQSIKLFQQSISKPHLVYNLMTLFSALCQQEEGKNILREKVKKDVEKLANGPNEMVQNRCIELLKLLNS